ncbi:BTB/POZ domain,Zinc finger C2H2-type,SKP1/BTB/POZ domain [Cinara cedri]|uniref:BTB/POZ domain,Zinc finger C2H2-type,SKP1/BTB/POZ domain n=1 Tax=Cinara cedri TaxID=506608 RepID=A0A5E4MRW2_9HEMI|nr:BTB/POZ domain,Zinc finger C2H2-type,SKP1/BTB/POZ domain [Cinara cedri]
MDTSTQYSMRWDDFSSHFTSEFESLRNDEQFVDVTLCCDDRFIKAHKVILSACSPYFKKILMMNPSKHVTVIMHNVEYELMKTLVDFMYLGEVLINQNNVERFFKLAKTFNIQGFQNGFNKNENLILPSLCENVDQDVSKSDVIDSINNHDDGLFVNQLDQLNQLVNTNDIIKRRKIEINYWQQSSEINLTTQPEKQRGHSLDPRPCPECGRQYSSLSNLRQHIELIHKPGCVVCPICGKTFKNKLYLRRHFISFHEMMPSKIQNTSDTGTPYTSNSLHYPSDQNQPRLQIKEQSNSQQLNSTCFDQNIHPR